MAHLLCELTLAQSEGNAYGCRHAESAAIKLASSSCDMPNAVAPSSIPAQLESTTHILLDWIAISRAPGIRHWDAIDAYIKVKPPPGAVRAACERTTGRSRRARWGIQEVLQDLGKAAGLRRRFYPHLLRRTAAVLRVEQGIDVQSLRQLFGWRDSRMPEKQREYASAVAWCLCPDSRFRRRTCKHSIALMIAKRHNDIMNELHEETGWPHH